MADSNGQNGFNEGLREALENLATYPVLTDEITSPSGSGGRAPSGAAGKSGGAGVGALVRDTIRDVIGWRSRDGGRTALLNAEAEGITQALQASFAARDNNGRTLYDWTPRSAYTSQAELGVVTGAQWSFYTRFRTAIAQILPLIHGLSALRNDADDDDIAAHLDIVDAGLRELEYELSIPGGPRVQRVDEHLKLLLGPDPEPGLDNVGGELGLLRDEFGLGLPNVNTIAEEQTATNFLIAVDSVHDLYLSWRRQRDSFDREGVDVYFGPQMVLLSRAFEVVSESCDELEVVADSVFIGEAERQLLKLDLGENEPPLYLKELVDWARRFAATEARGAIQRSGKAGVVAFTPMLARLTNLAGAARLRAGGGLQNPDNVPPGYGSLRFQRAVVELHKHLQSALDLAEQIRRLPRPDIRVVDPNHALVGETVRVSVNGDRFQPGARVHLTPGGADDNPKIEGANVTVVSATQINATFDLLGVDPDQWSIVVTNPDGGQDWHEDVFTVAAPPQEPIVLPPRVKEFSPVDAPTGSRPRIALTGERFAPGATTVTLRRELGAPAPVLIGTVADRTGDTGLTVVVDLDGVDPGTRWILAVANPDGGVADAPGVFTVTEEDSLQSPTPTITGFEPRHAAAGPRVTIDLAGTDFANDAQVVLRRGSAETRSGIVSAGRSETKLSAVFDLSNAPAGSEWTLAVINPGVAAAEAIAKELFVVDSAPEVAVGPPVVKRIVPPGRGPAAVDTSIVLEGENLGASAAVTLVREEMSGSTPLVHAVQATSVQASGTAGKRLTAVFDLSGRAGDDWRILVVTPGGLGMAPGRFVVEPAAPSPS